MAEDVEETSAAPADADGGGGGGNPFQEEINKQCERVDAFISTLDFRGKAPNKKQRLQLGQRVMVAFAAGWTERGLTRYLDISDATDVRSAAALYLHRLDDENLPDSGQAEAIASALPPPCATCQWKEGAATDAALRIGPFGGPCPDCHPDAVQPGAKRDLPPVCDSCVRANPAARTNIRFRTDSMSFTNEPCPRCHPAKVSPALTGTDARVQGWYDVGRQLAAEEAAKAGPQPQIARGGYQPYQDPEDQSVYDKPL